MSVGLSCTVRCLLLNGSLGIRILPIMTSLIFYKLICIWLCLINFNLKCIATDIIFLYFLLYFNFYCLYLKKVSLFCTSKYTMVSQKTNSYRSLIHTCHASKQEETGKEGSIKKSAQCFIGSLLSFSKWWLIWVNWRWLLNKTRSYALKLWNLLSH